MKKLTFIFLLCAGMLLSLAGCQEKPVTPDGNKEGALVEFAVVAGNPATRTSFSGAGTGDPGNLSWERIDWVKDDQVLIWSDKATSKAGSGKSAVYSILTVTADGDESRASIADPSETGLRYAVEGGDHKFWGLYPASAVSTAPTDGSLSFSISGKQTGTMNATSDTCKPNMNQAVMLAAIEGAQPKQKVDIRFYPAFTAFELTFKLDENYEGTDPVYLHHVTLTSSSDLVGTVNASIVTGKQKFTVNGIGNYAFISEGKEYTAGASTYTFASTAKTVIFNLPQAVELTENNSVTLTIFTLPQNVNDLTIGMGMGENGDDLRTGTLRIGTGADKKNLAFAACQKHNIRGVLVKPNDWEFSTLTFNFENPWEKVEFDPVSSRDYPQSMQFEPTGDIDNLRTLLREAHSASSGYDGYRQCWVFNADGTATVTYKVMLPAGGTWKLAPQGDTDSFVVSVAGVTPASDGSFTGPISNDGTTRITFTIKPASGAYGAGKDPKVIYFKTSVTNAAGTTYSLDSETQLYDMRGYHYFIINTADQTVVDGLLNQ